MSDRKTADTLLARTAGSLFPGSFALVMATGIISLAAHLLGQMWLARILLWANAAFYTALWILTLMRLVLFFRRIRADFLAHAAGPGFFTTVAGTCVFGTQVALVAGCPTPALALWFVGLGLWLFLIYGFFTAAMTAPAKPTFPGGFHGGWLVSVVATQSVAVLATVLSTSYAHQGVALLFLSLCLCLAGGVLYLILITLLFYRMLYHPLAPGDFSPLSWIFMGAAAITALSGARLLSSSGSWEFLVDLRGFLQGYTLLFWSVATWWIPLLVCLWVWRHLVKRDRLRYEPQYWSTVFPLGMYTTCTVLLVRVTGLEFLLAIPQVFLWIALAVWLAAFGGMTVAVARALRGNTPAAR